MWTVSGLNVVKSTNNRYFESIELSPIEKTRRLATFYSKAAPVFFSYIGLDSVHYTKKILLGKYYKITDEEEDWNKLHDWGSQTINDVINELKGYYVKAGQIISTRVDIFPEQYTSKLSSMQDNLEPVNTELIKDEIRRELLGGAELTDLFSEFDDTPIGSASIAQVHRARLLDGRVVAVKVQKPGIEAKLLGDIGNLKAFSKLVSASLPVDYHKVFCELEKTLIFELDFFHEAQAMLKMAAAVSHTPNNRPKPVAPVQIPLPIMGLVSRRVIVMDFVEGIPLSKAAAEMKDRGIGSNSVAAKLFGRRLLSALTDAYSSMIFGSGIIHGDPHPGNIFICPNGDVALLDCGQVKTLTHAQIMGLASIVLCVNTWEKAVPGSPVAQEMIRSLAEKIRVAGVLFRPGVGDECAAAVAILLLGNNNCTLPGGYSGLELSSTSPIVQIVEFPAELVLLGRATFMIKGIASKLGLAWGLSDRWAAVAQEALAAQLPHERLPVWSAAVMPSGSGGGDDAAKTLREVQTSVTAAASMVLAYARTQVLVRLPQAVLRLLLSVVPRLLVVWRKILAVGGSTNSNGIV